MADDIAVQYRAEIFKEPHVPVTEAEAERWAQPYGPSYDCKVAKGVADLTVCSDPVLSRMDLEVTTLHRTRLEDLYAGHPIDVEGRASSVTPSRDDLEDEQRRWLRARDDECDLDFDFHAGIGAHYEAVPCLIAHYAKRLVELDSGMRERTGRKVLDVLANVGVVASEDMVLDLGNVRLDLPRLVPVTSTEAPSPTTLHPACIDALTSASAPSLIRRSACRAGTVHLPLALDTWFDTRYEAGLTYVTYIPWLPHRSGQRGDRFGYRVVGELDNGRVLTHVVAESTGAGRTIVVAFLAVMLGLQTGETVNVQHEISDEGLAGVCGAGIWEVNIVNPDTLRLASIVPAETLVTLFDWFPEEFPGVTGSERRRLRSLKDSGELDVATSSTGKVCIGHAHYVHNLESGRRTLAGVSLEVAESDRAGIVHSPALACLFDLLLERNPAMPAMYRPTQFNVLLTDFIDKCQIPDA